MRGRGVAGSRNPSNTTGDIGVGTDGREVHRTYEDAGAMVGELRNLRTPAAMRSVRTDGSPFASRRRRSVAGTLAFRVGFSRKPNERRFARTVGGRLLTQALRPEDAREAGRLVSASASGGQKPPRS
jgi:hypothetical protein